MIVACLTLGVSVPAHDQLLSHERARLLTAGRTLSGVEKGLLDHQENLAPELVVAGQAGDQTGFSSSVHVEAVPVYVVDSSGEPVSGLTQDDFALSLHGEVRQITAFADRASSATALLVDTSFSAAHLKRTIKRTVAALVTGSDRTDCYVLVPFDARVTMAGSSHGASPTF